MKLNVKFSESVLNLKTSFGEVYKVSTDSENDGTYILVTPDGDEIPAVLVDELTIFDATENDIREGKTAATDSGVTTGTKVIPSYQTNQGVRVIMPNSSLIIKGLSDNNEYDYTKLQTIICLFNTSLSDSVAAEKVSIDDAVYETRSTELIASVTKNHIDKTIEFGIVNNSDKPYIIRYFTYKEIE